MAALVREPILDGDQAQLFRLGAATADTAVFQELGSGDIARARARALSSELVLVLREDVAASFGNQLSDSLVRGDTRSIEPMSLLVLVVHRSPTPRAALRDEKRD